VTAKRGRTFGGRLDPGLSMPIEILAHEDVIVGVVILDPTVSVASMTDVAGNTYTLKVQVAYDHHLKTEQWEAQDCLAGDKETNFLTITLTTPAVLVVAVEVYAGVIPQDGSMTPQDMATAFNYSKRPTCGLAVQEVGNLIVGIMGFRVDPGINYSIQGGNEDGTIRQSYLPAQDAGFPIHEPSVGIVLMDVVGQVAATVPLGVGISAPGYWTATALELRGNGIDDGHGGGSGEGTGATGVLQWSFAYTQTAPGTPSTPETATVTCTFVDGGCPEDDAKGNFAY